MGNDPGSDGVPTKKVAVLGGGLAGLSAARRLLALGHDVTLVEKRPFLGGRAFSFRDSEEDVDVDNGQHVFMGCCSYYIDYLSEIGALQNTYQQDGLRTEVYLNGTRGTLYSTRFLGRLHLLPSFLTYRLIGLKDKLLVTYGLLRAKLTDRSRHRTELDGESGYDWLKRHHQTDRAIANLWSLVVLPTLNDNVRNVSADMMLMVFQEGLLKGPKEASIGISRVGLTTLNGDPARRFIEERGGRMVMGKAVRAVHLEDGRVAGVELSDGETLVADAYVSALPFKELLEVLPHELSTSPFFAKAGRLQSAPIVGIHIWYDRPIMDQDFVAFLESPVQWVFNKSLIQQAEDDGGQYVCISLSGAWQHVDKPKEELKEDFVQEMARLFPRARDANVRKFLVVKEPQATFRSEPGAGSYRLPQKTPVANLFLAGEWTDTGWPSTMEGAVRSGVFAADALNER